MVIYGHIRQGTGRFMRNTAAGVGLLTQFYLFLSFPRFSSKHWLHIEYDVKVWQGHRSWTAAAPAKYECDVKSRLKNGISGIPMTEKITNETSHPSSPESYEKIWKENFLLLGIHSLV